MVACQRQSMDSSTDEAPSYPKDGTNEEVDKTELASKNKRFRARAENAAHTSVNSDRPQSYGTQYAREYLKKGAKDFASAAEQEKATDRKAKSERENRLPLKTGPPS